MDTTTLTMLASTLVLLQQLIKRREQRKRKRRFSVRPLNRELKRMGNFYSLFTKMREIGDHESFFKYTRMSMPMFDQLLSLISPYITKRRTKLTISAEERLCITLRYLAEGCSMQEMAFNFKLGLTTVHNIIKETTSIIWERLGPIYLPFPSYEKLGKVTDGFYKRWNFPNCAGALDGKHIQIRCPKYSGTENLNYHKNFSIILMASCDAFYKFTFVDIGSPGSNHDSTVFSTSTFGEGILNGTVQFPDNRDLPNTEVNLPTFFVADQAFPLHTRIMRPYPGKNLGDKKNTFNYRLSRARRMIENTFGILAQRWRIFLKPIVADVEMCERITKAAVVLHNFVQRGEEDLEESERKYNPTGYVDREDGNGNIIPGAWRREGAILRRVGQMGSNNTAQKVKKMRDILADYFVTPMGAVPWQQRTINRGAAPDHD